MLLPIASRQVGVGDGVAAVDHHVVAHIQTDMRDAADILAHRPFKKDQVAGTRFIRRNLLTDAVQPRRAEPARVLYAAVGKYIGYKAGAVKGRIQRRAAPDIRKAQIFFRFLDELSKLRVSLFVFLRHVV